MNHFASPQFWDCYNRLPIAVRQLADKSYLLMKQDPQHPSICLKKVGRYYAARWAYTIERSLSKRRMD